MFYTPRMGQNRRYPGHTIDGELERLLIRPQPISLTDDELDLAHSTVVEARRPIPVRAWVRYHEATARPQAVAVAWTDKAVRVEWEGPDGARQSAWVWANAVERA